MIKETIGLFDHPYMSGKLQVHDDGTSYPMVKLARAGVVVPFKNSERGCEIYLIEQPRPECQGETCLKTIGAYLRAESPVEMMKKALSEKAGIFATGNLHLIGKSVGYSVARAEIYCYCIQSFDAECPMPHVRCLLLEEAIDKALRGEMLDDCSTIPLLALYRELKQ